MWVFGLVTLIEDALRRLIVKSFPDGSWAQHLPAARLEKAHALREERERRGDHATLVECLQFGDTAHIVFKHEDLRQRAGFDSRRSAKQATKRMERLRNLLAHSQRIDDESIVVITNLAADIERILSII